MLQFVGIQGELKLQYCKPDRKIFFRVIYYWFVWQDVILLLFVYSKSERDDLTAGQLRQLKAVVEREYHEKRTV